MASHTGVHVPPRHCHKFVQPELHKVIANVHFKALNSGHLERSGNDEGNVDKQLPWEMIILLVPVDWTKDNFVSERYLILGTLDRVLCLLQLVHA